MNRRVALINDKQNNNRMSYLDSVSIVSSFGDRAYIGMEEDEKYDGVISSFISDSDRILEYREKIADAKLDNGRLLYICDPDFAKNGEKYASVTDKHIANYKKLMEVSDIITPNFTEAIMLTDMEYDENSQKYSIIKYENDTKEKADKTSKKIIESMFPLLDKIRFKKNQITVITGIELYNAVLTILDIYDGDHGRRQTSCNYAEKVESRTGVGDVFDAMFFETSTNGLSLNDALIASTSFVNSALRYSRDYKIDEKLGVFFEPIIHSNINLIRKKIEEKKKKDVKGV